MWRHDNMAMAVPPTREDNTDTLTQPAFCWPAGCSVCPTSRRRASSPRSLICPSDAWCQRSGTLPAQGGLWRCSAWTSGLHPTATGNRPRIQPAGEVRGPSLAGSEGRMIREKEEGQRCGKREDKEECEWRCECCAVGKKKTTETTAWCWKLSGAEVIILEAPADTQRDAGGSIHQPAAHSFQNSITALLTLLLIYIIEPQASLPATKHSGCETYFLCLKNIIDHCSG